MKTKGKYASGGDVNTNAANRVVKERAKMRTARELQAQRHDRENESGEYTIAGNKVKKLAAKTDPHRRRKKKRTIFECIPVSKRG